MATDNRDPRTRRPSSQGGNRPTGTTRSTGAPRSGGSAGTPRSSSSGSPARRKKKKKSAFKRFIDRNFTLCMVVLLAILALLIFLIIHGMKGDSGETPGKTVTPTSAPTEGVKEATATPTVAAPTATPEPADSPTPTPEPTPYVYGLCSSVTLNQDSEPVDGDDWEIDYLMLVNWSHRLKYKGNPENLVRIDEVLTADFYTIQNPNTVNKSDLNFIIEKEEDNYGRGNRVALEHLDEMCHDYHEATSFGVKISQTGAYRNYATQDRFWQNRDKSINPPRTVPGNASEHRTGLGFDIWTLDGGGNDTTWFRENCYKYGFILRYPSDKKKITGVTYEQWHFRYVGLEAAKEIFDLGYCLEEYIAYKNGEDLSTLPKY